MKTIKMKSITVSRVAMLAVVLCLCCATGAKAEEIVLKRAEGYAHFSLLRAGHEVFPESVVLDTDAKEIRIPDVGIWDFTFGRHAQFPNLKKVTFGSVDNFPGNAFADLPMLEEIEFTGLIGTSGHGLVRSCPNLRRIVFRGPVVNFSGRSVATDCPRLEEIVFESVVGQSYLTLRPDDGCPALKYTIRGGAFLTSNDKQRLPVATPRQLKKNRRLMAAIDRLADWQMEVLQIGENSYCHRPAYSAARALEPVLQQVGRTEKALALKKMTDSFGDDQRNKIEVLKESPAYVAGDIPEGITFRYADASDPMLTQTREKFRLDSIAGTGDDVSRIKNILYWVHDQIPHNGSNGMAPGPATLENTIEQARLNRCGYNCRALAICLTEALLAVGIPARYLDCIPRAYMYDSDAHIICVAWSESLGKWIWVDPSFAAYVSDENGLLLHPGEVRYRLQHDLPLVLNEDANWNHEVKQTKEYYLEDYMAKNLYIIRCNTWNQYDPEGSSEREHGMRLTLLPQGVRYPHTDFSTSDEAWFWQAP